MKPRGSGSTRKLTTIQKRASMGFPSGIYDIKFVEQSGQHTTDKDTRRGTVTVRYGNGMRQDFTSIRRKDFFMWYLRNWKRPPRGITLR